MLIRSINDPEFLCYGRPLPWLRQESEIICTALQKTPMPEGIGYVAEEPLLQNLAVTETIRNHCFGGMPIQMGWCNGHNTKLNCLEYHRCSEVNLGTEDFVLLLALPADIRDGILDTSAVQAFLVPAGLPVEIYPMTLHYAPCQGSLSHGFQVLIALLRGTNVDCPQLDAVRSSEDSWLWACNKWLLAHAESAEVRQGAAIALRGVNIDIQDDLSNQQYE